jgi:hypothetical protein
MNRMDSTSQQDDKVAKDLVQDTLDNSPTFARRSLLKGASVALGGSLLFLPQAAQLQNRVQQEESTTAPDGAGELAPPAHSPSTEYVFTILATIDAAMTVGDTPSGQIRAIPITGGEVTGEGISGRVVPGGADWQRTRADGVTEIEATYAIEMTDKTLVKVINRGMIDRASAEAPAYFRTAIHFDAPSGPYGWLNEALFLCKAGLHPERDLTVVIEVFKLV